MLWALTTGCPNRHARRILEALRFCTKSFDRNCSWCCWCCCLKASTENSICWQAEYVVNATKLNTDSFQVNLFSFQWYCHLPVHSLFQVLYPEEVCIALAKRFGSFDCRVWYALTSCIWYLGTDCEATTETQSNLSTTDAHSCCAARSCLPRKKFVTKTLGNALWKPSRRCRCLPFWNTRLCKNYLRLCCQEYPAQMPDDGSFCVQMQLLTRSWKLWPCMLWREKPSGITGLSVVSQSSRSSRRHMQELRGHVCWLLRPCSYQYQQFLGQGLLSYEIYRCSSVACCSPRSSGPIVWRSPHSGYDVLGDHRGPWHVHLVSTTIASALAGLSLLVHYRVCFMTSASRNMLHNQRFRREFALLFFATSSASSHFRSTWLHLPSL